MLDCGCFGKIQHGCPAEYRMKLIWQMMEGRTAGEAEDRFRRYVEGESAEKAEQEQRKS